MRIIVIILISFFTLPNLFSQNLSVFNNLVNKTWKAEGNWGDGSIFKQTIDFEYGLDSTILKSKTYGFIDENQQEFGLRNEGIRRLDTLNNTIQFWEFDIFGGLTTGNIVVKNQSFYYQYQYGSSLVTDYWTYIDENTYQFKVGIFSDGKWSQVFLKSEFKGFSE